MTSMNAGSDYRWRRHLLLTILVLLAASDRRHALSQGTLVIGNFQLVAETRMPKGGGIEFTYRATLTNNGPAIAGATASVVSLSPKIVILDNTLTFGPVGAGGSAVSLDTFSLTKNGRGMFDPALIAWTISSQPINQAPQVNAGPDLSVTLPRNASLLGTVTDDGLPLPPSVTVAWSQQSGPGSVVFGNASLPATTAAFSQPGTYVLRLTAGDGAATSFDEVTVVAAPNQPPVANAGPDQTAPVGASVVLNGSGSTDANGDALTYAWSFTSRPPGSTASLSDTGAVTPGFTIDKPGAYVIQLVVNDGLADSVADSVTVSTSNSAPVAHAGADRTALVTQTAMLDGSLSSDVDGDLLSFAWGFASRPAGSAAVLTNGSSVNPSFVVDVPGIYQILLVVHDGHVASVADSVTVTTLNSPPVANAGTDQSVFVGATVTLNGSGSTDVDGDLLTHAWSLTTVPPGSAATLTSPTALMPTFVADRAGTYVAQLIVNDGTVPSAPDTVMITTQNSAPVANAGPDQSVVAGAQVQLNGTTSSDVDGDPLTYAWSFTAVPQGSTAALSGGSTSAASFAADRVGTYVVQLIVHDGTVFSPPDTVTISTTNSTPTANAGVDRIGVPVGVALALDGSASSDPDGHGLSYAWSLITRPATSAAALAGATTAAPTLTPDVPGDYVVQLIVNDGFADSAPDTVLVRTNNPPIANAGADQIAQAGATVNLDGSESSDPDGNPLSFAWSFASRPAGSTATLQNANTSTPSFVADLPGSYQIDLAVTDSVGATAHDTVGVTVFGTPVVTVATIDAAASETGPDAGMFRLTRSGNVSGSLTVDFAIGGTAQGDDYGAIGASASFAAGAVTVDVTVTPVDDAVVEGAETVTLTLIDGAAYELGPQASDSVTIADNDQHGITLTLLDTAVVGVGSSATLQVTLGAPAPEGGALVTVASDAPGIVAVAPPGTVTIAGGATGGQVTVNGVSAGTTTVRANTTGFSEGTLAVTATNNIIALPVSLNVPFAQGASLPITITRDAGSTGDVVVSVTSDAPAAISVATPLVTIPSGQFTANATVVGQGVGSATLTASASGFVTDTTASSTSASLDITVPSVTINGGFGGSITIELESPLASPVPAPAGGLVVALSAANATCVSVPATVTIGQGTISTTAAIDYGGSATLPCTSTITASGPAGVTQDTVTVTVNAAPAITIPALGSIGGGLQSGPFTASLGASNHGGVTVHVVSGDPRVLIAPNLTTPGSASIDVDVADGVIGFQFVLQGADWAAGSSLAGVTVTASAPAFSNGTSSVNYVQPAVRLLNVPATSTTLSANADFYAEIGVAQAGHVDLLQAQERRAGGSALTVTVTNSNGTVAEIDLNGGGTGGQLQTATIGAGADRTPLDVAGGLEFDPRGVGSTTLSASIPEFVTTATGSRLVSVTGPGMTVPPLSSIGGGLQSGPFTGQLGASNHGGVTVHLVSGDPRVLIAPNVTTPGTASIDVDVADGATAFQFVLQGADWAAGSIAGGVTVTASAPAFSDGTSTVNYVQPAVRLLNVPATSTTLSANTDFRAEIGVAQAGNADLQLVQERRPGGSTLTVTVTNSNEAVAEIDLNGGGAGAQLQTATIGAGADNTPFNVAGGLEFDPRGVGSTTLSASIPEFITTTTGSRLVSVTGPGMTVPPLGSIGGGLQNGPFTGQLGASNHGGVTVRVESGDPRVLIAPNVTTEGSSFIEVNVADGATAFAFVLQGADWNAGSSAAVVTVTASAPGFSNDTSTVNYVQPATRLALVPSTTTTLSANTDFRLEIGIPVAGNVNLAQVQERRPGPGVLPLTVTVTNSNASVAELDPNGGGAGAQLRTAIIAIGATQTPMNAAGGLEFDPLGSGSTTVNASIPGFIQTNASTVTVSVSAPSISLPVMGALGGGLQNGIVGTLQVSGHGGVTVHLSSSDPSRVLLSSGAATEGTAEIDIAVPNGSNSFNYFVQGLDWVDGVSSAATVVITASAPGFLDDTNTVTYQKPALRLQQLVTAPAASAANDDFIVQVGVANGSLFSAFQERRAGGGSLTVTVNNSNAAVAELDPNGGGVGAQQRTAIIAEGASSTPNNVAGGLEFDPLAAGSTTVSASIPGFIVTTTGTQVVNVSP